MSPYRGGELAELPCPRCKKKKLPPTDVAACACGGVWVTAFAASEVLSAKELRPDPVTRWWRVREPCPACGEKMMLYGNEPGLFQGCELHGYFIDGDIVEHTQLANGVDHAALDRKRDDQPRVDAERENRERAASRRAQERAERERREAELAQVGFVSEPESSGDGPTFEEARATYLEGVLRAALGPDGADLLLRRIRELEARVEQLERER